MMDRIAVLIPCWNEALTIEKVVSDFKRVLPEAVIYVYDNNSTDRTADLAARAGAVVRHEADARGVFLGDEVMDFMLNRFSRDLGSLMQLLDQLDAYALRTQRAITIPLLKAMLESE